jgi:hypothetical protein
MPRPLSTYEAMIYRDADPQNTHATKISSKLEITVQIHTCGRRTFRSPKLESTSNRPP